GKGKEPVVAEVARARVREEELMELFYSGQGKETERQNDEGDGSETGTIAAGSERDRISPKPEKGEPFPSEGYLKEPSNKEPLTYDPTQTQSSLPAAVRQPLDKPTQSLQIEQT